MRGQLVAIGIATVVQLAGCGGESRGNVGVRSSESDSAGLTVVHITGSVQDLPLWEIAAVPVTEISGDAAPFLGSVGEVQIRSDGSLLVEDNQSAELRLFDVTGNEVRILGGRGHGPGEFQNLTELTVTAGDTAYAYDRRLYRISRFNPDGSLAGTMDVGRERAGPGSLVLDAWAVNSERLLLHSLGREGERATGRAYRDQRDAVLHVLDGSGNEIAAALQFTGGYSISGSHGDVRAPFANRPFVSVGAGRVVHGSGLSYELIVRAPDLQPVRIVRWDGWKRPLNDEILRAVRDSIEADFAEFRTMRPDLFTSLLEALFEPNLLPDTLPAVSSALLDDSGRIWVSQFRPTTHDWNEQDRWHVLDPSGAPLARLQLPPSARLAAVKGSSVALVVRDELDVEHVRVFELVQGGPQTAADESRDSARQSPRGGLQ